MKMKVWKTNVWMLNAGNTNAWKTKVGKTIVRNTNVVKTKVGKSIATKLDHTPNVEKKNVR